MATAEKLPIKPIGANILVKPEAPEEVTKSGLVIASSSSSNDRPQRGEIIAVGTGKLDEKGNKLPFNVEVGQKIVFKKYSPDEIELDGAKYLIMQEEDVLAVLI